MSSYTGANLLIDQLSAETARVVFTKPGIDAAPFLEALEKRDEFRKVLLTSESIAVLAALGYAQAAGKPGVVSISGTTGAAAALAALKTAMGARAPLVVLAAQKSAGATGEFFATPLDICQFAAPFSKWACRVDSIIDLPRAVRRAFHESLSPPMGPTVVAIPSSLLQADAAARVLMPPRLSPIGAADASFVKRAAQILATATKPGVLAGNEVSQYHARKELAALVEVLGCAAHVEPNPTGVNFPSQHRLSGGTLPSPTPEGPSPFEGCDVVLAVGVQNREALATAAVIPTTAVVLQINIDASLAGRGLPCHFTACGDLAESLSKLRAEIQLQVDNPWVGKAKERSRKTAETVEARRSALKEADLKSGEDATATVRWMLRKLDELKPRKSIVVNDIGRFSDCALAAMNLEHSGSYLASGADLPGYALPAALGMQVLNAEYTVISISGDAALLQNPQTLWSAAHHELALKVIVLNNRGYTPAETPAINFGKGMILAGGGMEITNPPISFIELAGAMGVPAASVSKRGEIEDGLKEMLNSPGPFLLEVRVPS